MAGMRGSGDGAGMANTDMLQQMLFEEGDPSTWRESEWHWNSLDLVAEPRVGQQPAACEAMKGGRNLVVQPGAEAMNSVPQMLETMPPSNTFQRGVDASACNFTSRAPSFPHTVFPPGTHSQPSRQELNPQFARTGSGLALPRVSSSHVETAMHTPQISGRDYEMPMDISDSDNLSRLSQMGNAGLAGGSVASMNTHSFPCMGPLPTTASAHRPTQPGVVFASPCANGGTGNEPCSMEETKVVESSGSPRTDLAPTSIPADVPVLASDTSNLQLVCQVSGCGMDLENLKEYHQRYRICDIHIKLPRVMKNGRLQRFCQQCGRFHDLVAFDGNRRSCRDQLNKHNARRRKRASQKLKPEMAEVESFAEDDSEVGRFLQGLCKNPGHLRALRLLLGLPLNPALPPQCPMPAPFTSRAPGAPGKCSELCQCDVGTADVAIEDQSDECVDARPCPCSSSNAKSSSGKPPTPADVPVSAVQPSPQCPSSEDGTPCDITTYSLARKMVSCKEDFSATFETDERLQRLSLKLFNKTPSSLPAGLKEDILSWLGSAPTMMEGMIAPGCVLLTVYLLLASHVVERIAMAGVRGVVAHLLKREQSEIWRSSTMVVQLGIETAVVAEGKMQATMNLEGSCRAPRISDLHPVCLSPSLAEIVTVEAVSLRCDDCRLLCRTPESPIRVETWRSQDAPGRFKCCVEGFEGTRAAFLELACGAVLSEPRVLLLVDDDCVAEEINALALGKDAELYFGGRMDEFLLDLVLVFQGTDGNHRHRISVEELGRKARRLLAFACDHGCSALADRLFAAATWGCASVDEAIQDSISTKGLSLLHRAVRSGSTTVAKKLMEWAWMNSAEFCSCGKGLYGITPLHLSALLEDDGHMAVTLLSCCGPKIFTTVASDDGVTPFHLALQMGHFRVDKLICFLQYLSKKRCLNSTWQDTCETCDSALPPLLLSIMASCGLCGAQKLPAPHGTHAIEFPSATGEDPSSAVTTKRGRSSEKALSYLPATVAHLGQCDHEENFVYSITAMCQTCHTDRVLVVF